MTATSRRTGAAITSLTAVIRLGPGTDPEAARRVLAEMPVDRRGPFAASRRTHFGRLLVLDGLTLHQRRPLAAPVLVLSADFDGDDPEGYLVELLAHPTASVQLASVLALCAGAPGDPTAPGFARDAARYLLDRRIDIGLQFVNDPRQRSSVEIRRAVARHRRLVGFVTAHRTDPPAALREAFRRTFGAAAEAGR